MSKFNPLVPSKVLENWIEYVKSNMNLLSDYELSYIDAISNSLGLKYVSDIDNKDKLKTVNKNNNFFSFINPLSFHDSLLYISNAEFSKHLSSSNSLQHFKDHINSIVNLESSIRQNSPYLFPFFSSIDNFIDNNIKFLEPIVSFNETPYKVIKQEDATRLLHYYNIQNSSPDSSLLPTTLPSSERYSTDSVPLLLIYAPINRYHILDLSSERSIVRKFISAGFDVFLLDWGEKQNENKPQIKDYINYINKSIEQIQKITKKEKINLYGYSWGGTLAIIYTSIYNKKILNLVLQSANFDFAKDNTVIAEWMRNFPVEEFIGEFKEMYGHFIDLAFLMRNPIAHSLDNLKYALDMKEDEPLKFFENFVKIRTWINNTSDIPGPLFKQFVIDLYQKNLLIKNQLILEEVNEKQEEDEVDKISMEKTINLKNISIPILNIVANKDDLVSPKCSTPISEESDSNLISSKEKKLIEFPSGHVELCISYDAHKDLWPQVIGWLKERI